MNTLIIAEHNNSEFQESLRHVLAAALLFKQPITVLVAGYGCREVAEKIATLKGVQRVLLADKTNYTHGLAENLSELVVTLADNYSVILASASTFGKNLMPRVAALLDCMQVSDVTQVITNDRFEHPIYAGNAIETVRVLDDKKILTIRSTSFPAIQETAPSCEIEPLSCEGEMSATRFLHQELSPSSRPELGNAKIVVSGGRGLQSKEQFKLIEQLADCLGAAVGASRAAVDAGFAPNDYQVGQTGKIVAPDLYFAIGISGAVQHIAGMKSAKIIVAINKDSDAPIFKVADYGLVGDLFEILPQLIEALNQLKR